MSVLPSPEATIVTCTVILTAYAAHVLHEALASSARFEAMLSAKDMTIDLYQSENAKLQEEGSKYRDLYAHAIADAEAWHLQWSAEHQENAKLREAVATAIKVQAVLCGDADSLYCREDCPLHRQESDDCLACDVIGIAQELGLEVD